MAQGVGRALSEQRLAGQKGPLTPLMMEGAFRDPDRVYRQRYQVFILDPQPEPQGIGPNAGEDELELDPNITGLRISRELTL
jgi:hypothetical protein